MSYNSCEQTSKIKLQPFVYDCEDEDKNTDTKTDTVPESEASHSASSNSKLSKIPLTQKFVLCPRDFKDGYLMELLRSIRDDEIKLPVKVRSMIIFASTIRYRVRVHYEISIMISSEFPEISYL